MEPRERLDQAGGEVLLKIARSAITKRLGGSETDSGTDFDVPARLLEPGGTFVTLTKKGSLRGCIGQIAGREPLIEGVRRNALNAAFEDPRFPPVQKDEWGGIRIEVSVLTDPAPLEYTDGDDLVGKLRQGVDGVIIRKGRHQATFLPQVWEQLPDTGKFLSHLCVKAGLLPDAWKSGDLEVSTYRVQAFEEP